MAYSHERMLLLLLSMFLFFLREVWNYQRLLNELEVFRAGVKVKQNSLLSWSVSDAPVHRAAHHSNNAVASTNNLNHLQEVLVFLIQQVQNILPEICFISQWAYLSFWIYWRLDDLSCGFAALVDHWDQYGMDIYSIIDVTIWTLNKFSFIF